MSALASRIARLETKDQLTIRGRWIVLGGDPNPNKGEVSRFLVAQGISRQPTDMVLTGENHATATPGAALSLIEVIPVTQAIEDVLDDLDALDR